MERVVRDEDRRGFNYAHAGFFIRYLVTGEDGALAPGFGRFLARVADSTAATGEMLRQELGRTWEELDRGLGDFFRGPEPGDDGGGAAAGRLSRTCQ